MINIEERWTDDDCHYYKTEIDLIASRSKKQEDNGVEIYKDKTKNLEAENKKLKECNDYLRNDLNLINQDLKKRYEKCADFYEENKKLKLFIESLKLIPVSYFQSNERILMVSLGDANIISDLIK